MVKVFWKRDNIFSKKEKESYSGKVQNQAWPLLVWIQYIWWNLKRINGASSRKKKLK